MAAPALVLMSPATARPAAGCATATATALVGRLRRQRPDLAVESAVVGANARTGLDQTLAELAVLGHAEAVAVPLTIDAGEIDPQFSAAVTDARASVPELAVALARAPAPSGELLTALDRQLRVALKLARVRVLDALVLVCPATPDPLATASLVRLARRWGRHHKLPVSTAFVDGGTPTPAEAVLSWRRSGSRQVAAGLLFLASGSAADRAAHDAHRAGAVAVSEPLGDCDELARQVVLRYTTAAFDLVPYQTHPRPQLTIVRPA